MEKNEIRGYEPLVEELKQLIHRFLHREEENELF